MKTLCIRVDGNKEIATGHIGRCLSVARTFDFPYTNNIISQNRVIFIVSDENSQKILKKRFEKTDEFEIVVLHTAFNDMDGEVPKVIDCIKKYAATCLLVDSYFVSEKYLKALHNALRASNCSLSYIDDLQALKCYDTDIIINYGVSTPPEIYDHVPTKLVGPKYTPLRSQFSQKTEYNNVDFNMSGLNIFISSGGTDSQNILSKLISSIKDNLALKDYASSVSFHVLTSRLNSHFEELISLSEADKNIHIYEGISNVAEVMNLCDVAISAGGTTLCELSALGIPTISYLNAANQLNGIMEFDSQGVIPYAGDIVNANKMDAVIDNIQKYLINICASSYETRLSIHTKMQNYIDGLGASRIAKVLADN